MAFEFSLVALLRLRSLLERQQELLLCEANQHVAALQARIDSLDSQAASYATEELRQFATGLSAAELQFLRQCRSALLGQRSAIEKRLLAAREVRDSRKQSLLHARQQREVLEGLERSQLEIYRQDEARSEQRRLDDLLLLRRSYVQRS